MNEKPRILLVEDDMDWLEIYSDNLRDEDYIIETARSIRHAIDLLRRTVYDVVVTDLKMLGYNDDFGGFSVLQKTKELSPTTQVVVITGYGSRDIALRAMQQGAFDYVTKPPERERLKLCVRAALHARRMLVQTGSTQRAKTEVGIHDKGILDQPLQKHGVLQGFIANSQGMRVVYEQVTEAIDTSFSVLIYGERGTGKGFIAKTIHANSPRRSRPFSQVNCADLSGLHWNAITRNLSRIQGGTLFFDDISILSDKDQDSLDRLIPTLRTHDIRLIASANVNQGKEWIKRPESATIRPSLLQSIAQISIWVPPLRERKDGDDLPALIGYFIHNVSEEIEPKPDITVSSEAMRLLLEYDYRNGNISELYNIVRNAVNFLGGEGAILPEHLLLPKGKGIRGITRILFLASDPTNTSRLRLGEEFREISEQLMLALGRDYFDLLLPQLSLRPKDIARVLLNTKPHIVHFSGHGDSEGALCFEDNNGQVYLVQPEALAALFEQLADQVQCVVLNACYSEIQARAISKHISYVIGMNKAVSDRAAIAFSLGFYQALGAGRSIDEAFRFGCVQMQLHGLPEHLTPVLIKSV
jgi:DNA-binding NtrC family response regulator